MGANSVLRTCSLRGPASVCLALTLVTPLPVSANPLGMVQQPQSLRDQQIAYAKQLFGEGLSALDAGNFTLAVNKFEEAYRYAPELHVFNFNIANAAYAGGDCTKAKAAFQRFLDLVPEHAERTTAQQKLLEIEQSGCAKAVVPSDPTPPPQTQQPQAEEPPPVEDTPVLSKRDRSEDDEGEGDGMRGKGKYRFNKPMVAGIGLIAGGGLALVGGAITFAIASGNKKKLEEKLENDRTSFPGGDYSDDETFKQDQAIKVLNPITLSLLGLGGVLAITGVAVYFVGLKKCKNKQSASLGHVRLAGLGPALFPRGGGVSAGLHFGAGPRDRGFSRCD